MNVPHREPQKSLGVAFPIIGISRGPCGVVECAVESLSSPFDPSEAQLSHVSPHFRSSLSRDHRRAQRRSSLLIRTVLPASYPKLRLVKALSKSYTESGSSEQLTSHLS